MILIVRALKEEDPKILQKMDPKGKWTRREALWTQVVCAPHLPTLQSGAESFLVRGQAHP